LSLLPARAFACVLAACMLPVMAFAQTPDKAGNVAPGQQHTLTLPVPSEKVVADKGSVQFIGTATVIIRFGGLTILTDPNFLHKGEHVHLGYGLTSERLTDPAIDLDKLPPIDLVVLSHMHGDHFDQLVQEKLDKNIPIVTTPEASRMLDEMGFKNRYALGTWDALTVRKGDVTVRVTAMPGRHGPGPAARLLPEVMGSMLEFSGPRGATYRMYITGDTLIYSDIEEIPKRYPDIDLALLHLGGTRILGVMKVTMDGKDGVRMMQIVAPHHAIPIHYNDYTVFKSPLSDFEQEVKAAGLQGKVTYLKHGDTYPFQPKAR
jgi:L-ascorbate metabolism protein UlaG (beta-lactamase superfamily)